MVIEHWDCAVTDHFKKATQVYIFMEPICFLYCISQFVKLKNTFTNLTLKFIF